MPPPRDDGGKRRMIPVRPLRCATVLRRAARDLRSLRASSRPNARGGRHARSRTRMAGLARRPGPVACDKRHAPHVPRAVACRPSRRPSRHPPRRPSRRPSAIHRDSPPPGATGRYEATRAASLHLASPGLAPSHAIARDRTARRAGARRSSARPPSAHSRPPAGERNRRITRARTRPASPAAASRNDRAASSLRIRCEKARAVAGSARRRRRNPAARPAARRASG